EGIRDVEGKRGVPAFVTADFLAVDPDDRLIVDRLEVKDRPLSLDGLERQLALVPKGFRGLDQAAHAGKSRFGSEGDENFACPFAWLRRVLISHRVGPKAVQVRPVLALEHRPR